MPFGRIYKITNLINGKVYIGFTEREVKERWWEHQSPSQIKRKTTLYNAINKHGIENFICEEIYTSTDLEHCLSVMEPYFINEYNSYSIGGYNSTFGGEHTKMTPEVRAKISATKMGHIVSSETREKLSAHNRKSYKIIAPDNKEHYTNNLKEFCKTNNIIYSSLIATAPHRKNARTSCFGFRCEVLSA